VARGPSTGRGVLIIGASLDAANELARTVVQVRGAAFGWHRLTLPQLAALLAASAPTERRVLPLGHLGVQAICARVVHRLGAHGELGRYSSIAEGPGFARALARVVMELRLAKLEPENLIPLSGASYALSWMDAPTERVETTGSKIDIEVGGKAGGKAGIPFVAEGKVELLLVP
jgi:hypothetical protein